MASAKKDAKAATSVAPAATPLREVEADGIAKDPVVVPMVVGDDGVARGSATVEGDGSGTPLPDADASTIGPDATPLDAPELAEPPPPCKHCGPGTKATRPCSLQCFVNAGNDPAEFEAYERETDEREAAEAAEKRETVAAEAVARAKARDAMSKKVRVTIGPHGSLSHNGVVYMPGTSHDLPAAVVADPALKGVFAAPVTV